MADNVIQLPIYPARELPITGVRSEMILEKMKRQGRVMQKEEVLAWVKKEFAGRADNESGEVLITAGAGDIDTLVEPIKKIIG
jgi:UDP-N-acetylmuramate--alanine ligase